MKRRNRKPDNSFGALFGTQEQDAEQTEEVMPPAELPAEEEAAQAEEAQAPEEEPPVIGDGEEEAAPAREEEAAEDADAQEEERIIEEDAPPQETGDKPRRGKVKEPMPRKKKVIIGVIAAVLAVAVIAAVVVPVALFFSRNHTVSSAEDLLAVEWDKLNGKAVYLQKDIAVEGDLEIPAGAVVDLHGHTLSVGGALKISGGTVQIGTVSGDGFNEKGALSAAALQADDAGSGVELFADTSLGDGAVNAGVFRVARALTLEGTLAVSADNAYIEGSVNGGENALLTFTGGRAKISGSVAVHMMAQGGVYAEVEGGAADITADGQSYVVLSGSAASVTGGKGVLALKNFRCDLFIGMEKLGVFVQSCTGSERMEDVDDIFYIEQLQTPPAVQVDIRGERVILTVTEVEHAAEADFSYRVEVNGEIFENEYTEEIDITSAIPGAGVYDIFVIAQGNFKADKEGKYDIDSLDKDVYYIDSYPCGVRYEHTFTLATPDNLKVTEYEGGVRLSFNPVAFADYYNIYIGDGEAVRSEENELDIAFDKLTAGANSIYVQAMSENEQILSSARALIGYVKYEKLATPAVNKPVVNGREVAVGWTKTEGSPARIFEVVFTYNTAGGPAQKIVRTTGSTLTVTLDDMTEGSGVSVSVKAIGYGYYLTGDAGVSTSEG